MEYCKNVMVPVQCEYYALEGLVALKQTIKELNQALKLNIKIVAILRTMADWRNRLTREVSDQLEKHYTRIEFYQLWPEPKCENNTQQFSFNSRQFYCFAAPSKVEKYYTKIF